MLISVTNVSDIFIFLTFAQLFAWRGRVHLCHHAGQRTACKSQFFPSVVWVLEAELRSSGVGSFLLSCLIGSEQRYLV